MYFACNAELCGPGQFPCLTEGERCIEDAYVCDGIPDCIVSFFPFTVFDEQQCLDSGEWYMDTSDRQIDRQTDGQTDRQTDKQTDRQTDRHTDRWTDRQTDR